jgi:hypothetical protein
VSEGCAQVVKVQLCRPARVFAVLLGQGVDDQLRQAWEALDATAQTIFEGGHRVIGLAGRVIPTLQCGQAKADVKARCWMAPGLDCKQAQGGLQFSLLGWCGQQRADD